MQPTLSREERSAWESDCFLIREGVFVGQALEELVGWTEELAAWPETPGRWMKYFERTTVNDRQLCRIENFLEYHAGLREIILGNDTMSLIGELLGEAGVLFKEKINYKLDEGSGFLAHQDAPAFLTFGQRYHITMLVTVDPMTLENGCLEISGPEPIYTTLPQESDGTIAKAQEEERAWQALEVPAGTAVFFDSYLPHRSGRNLSGNPRRALYLTYNRASEGDCRADYYRHKREIFPPECERKEGMDYTAEPGPYNLGNPIR